MNITKIKGIPNYVLGRIKRLDKKNYPKPDGHTRYYSYLTKIGSEICKITVAVRHRYSKWLYKQCAVHGKDSKNAYCKDMTFYYSYSEPELIQIYFKTSFVICIS